VVVGFLRVMVAPVVVEAAADGEAPGLVCAAVVGVAVAAGSSGPSPQAEATGMSAPTISKVARFFRNMETG
jgi:hypothetical protein